MEEIKKAIYPIEPWTIRETSFKKENNYRNETTFALSNGYIGTRGTFEENYDFGVDVGLEGNFINGFYESEHIKYGEWNYGFPTESQSLLNLPNTKIIKLYVNDELFDMNEGLVEEYERVLHMKDGLVTRNLVWTSNSGKKIKLETRRFVSFTHKNLMEIAYKVTPLNFSGEIRLVSVLDADVENHTRKTNPLVDYGPFGRRLIPTTLKADDTHLYYEGCTLNSKLTMACGLSHTIKGAQAKVSVLKDEFSLRMVFDVNAEQGEPIVLEKYMVYTSALDMDTACLEDFTITQLEHAKSIGYDKAQSKQIEFMHEYWNGADVIINGDQALQQGIRFNLFHIMQSAGRDGRTGMGAKGLTGEGYEGHYFWDTEMYVLPVFVYSDPKTAKKLLDYRYHTLNEARDRARVLGHDKGALYPWRTINGTEASTYFPLGTAQYHINADVAYAFQLYVSVTGDVEYLKEKAAEVLCETARVWADVGCFAQSKGGKYCICSVTGPDEYNAIVDNNFFTNLMARENLRNAILALELLRKEEKEAYELLVHKIDLKEDEIVLWQKIVDHMYFPYDETRQIYPQDDGFMMRKPWDDSKIPVEKRKLLYENYHPLFIFRQRMAKQADAILGMYLHSNFFTKEELKRNYDFYQEVTLHHSSLSTCIFGILACEIGYYDEAYEYFAQSARMDLDDYHNNFYAGIHAANMAGTWQAITNGFAGLRSNRGQLEFHPYIPKNWTSYQFRVTYKGNIIQVEIDHSEIKCSLIKGTIVNLSINDKDITLNGEGDTINEKI